MTPRTLSLASSLPQWLRHYQKAWLAGDLTAGLIVTVMLIPQSLAYALLAGLPIAIKDLEPVKGMRTTMGSPIFKDWVPDFDTLMIERFRSHGLSILGKTNTPEFGLGSQTFNAVFGATKNISCRQFGRRRKPEVQNLRIM